jgi:hypothetical protein
MYLQFHLAFLLSYEQGELCPGVSKYSRLFFLVQWMQREMNRFIFTRVKKRAFGLRYVRSWIVFGNFFVELRDSMYLCHSLPDINLQREFNKERIKNKWCEVLLEGPLVNATFCE